jgi:diadenosine tetraphosphate (Ap4A) HIT family hydrolase
MNSDECLSCNVTAGRVQTPGGVLFDDGLWHLTHQVSPALLAGWLILQPKRHIESLAELTPEEAAAFGPIMQRASKALEDATEPERLYVFSFGELVRHLHFYLIPRLAGMATGPGLLPELASKRWACSDLDAANVAMRVRGLLPD